MKNLPKCKGDFWEEVLTYLYNFTAGALLGYRMKVWALSLKMHKAGHKKV